MNKRQSPRRRILVDIEIARPGFPPCSGYARDISRDGVSVVLWEGSLPQQQRSVMLNFKIWTGSETLFRKLHARVLRDDGDQVALVFAEQDIVASAVVQDLLFYKNAERRRQPRPPHGPTPVGAGLPANPAQPGPGLR